MFLSSHVSRAMFCNFPIQLLHTKQLMWIEVWQNHPCHLFGCHIWMSLSTWESRTGSLGISHWNVTHSGKVVKLELYRFWEKHFSLHSHPFVYNEICFWCKQTVTMDIDWWNEEKRVMCRWHKVVVSHENRVLQNVFYVEHIHHHSALERSTREYTWGLLVRTEA